MPRHFEISERCHFEVKCFKIYLVVFEVLDDLVEFIFCVHVLDFVEGFGVNHVGSMVLKIRGVINQKFFDLGLVAVLIVWLFTHVYPAFDVLQ